MSSVADVMERKEIPAYVTFHKVPVEDKAESKRRGYYVAKDVDYVHITPPYSKDVVKFKVATWLENMKREVSLGRMPQAWCDDYIKRYEAWQKGQEMPIRGTPIRGWGVISPAQQETFIRLNILTVQDLARVNDEGIRRIGMGAIDLKNKALAWLAQMDDKGPLTQENADLKRQVREMEGSIATLERLVETLRAEVKAATSREAQVTHEPIQIVASDILPDDEDAPLAA